MKIWRFATVEELLILYSDKQDNLDQSEAQRRGFNLAVGVCCDSVKFKLVKVEELVISE